MNDTQTSGPQNASGVPDLPPLLSDCLPTAGNNSRGGGGGGGGGGSSFTANQTAPGSESTNQTSASLCRSLRNGTGGEGGGLEGDSHLKTFHMQPDYVDPSDLYVGEYDPVIGIRTAAILGSFLFVVMLYVLYKARCRQTRWTSSDMLFIEKYKEKLRNKDQMRRKSMHRRKSLAYNCHLHSGGGGCGGGGCSGGGGCGTPGGTAGGLGLRCGLEAAAMEATAKWIECQPLDTAIPSRRKPPPLNVCSVCMDSVDTPSCPVCSSSEIHISMTTGPLDTSLSDLGTEAGINTFVGCGSLIPVANGNHGSVLRNGDLINHVIHSTIVPMYKDTPEKNVDKSPFKKDINWKRDFDKGKYRTEPSIKSREFSCLEMDYLNLHLLEELRIPRQTSTDDADSGLISPETTQQSSDSIHDDYDDAAPIGIQVQDGGLPQRTLTVIQPRSTFLAPSTNLDAEPDERTTAHAQGSPRERSKTLLLKLSAPSPPPPVLLSLMATLPQTSPPGRSRAGFTIPDSDDDCHSVDIAHSQHVTSPLLPVLPATHATPRTTSDSVMRRDSRDDANLVVKTT